MDFFGQTFQADLYDVLPERESLRLLAGFVQKHRQMVVDVDELRIVGKEPAVAAFCEFDIAHSPGFNGVFEEIIDRQRQPRVDELPVVIAARLHRQRIRRRHCLGGIIPPCVTHDILLCEKRSLLEVKQSSV